MMTDEKSKIQQSRKRIFLSCLRITGNVRAAATAAKIGRTTHYAWLKSDPDYAEAVQDAYDDAIDGLEAEAVKRAKDGVEELVLHQGKPVMIDDDNGGQKPLIRKRYSDLLLIFMLKAARPKKFAHFSVIEGTGEITHNHKNIRDLPPEQQRERMDEYLKTYNRMMGKDGNDVDGLGNN